MRHIFHRHGANVSAIVVLMLVSACTSEPTTEPPTRVQRLPLERSLGLKQQMENTAKDARLMRLALARVSREAMKNPDVWFGKHGERTHDNRCWGVIRLLHRGLQAMDSATGRKRSPAERQQFAMQALRGTECGSESKPNMIFPVPNFSREPIQSSEEAEQYVAQNLGNSVWAAIEGYGSQVASTGSGSRESFTPGLTSLETEVFHAAANELDVSTPTYSRVVNGIAEPEEEDAMSVFRQYPIWYSFVVKGCIGGVIRGALDIYRGGVIGFSLWGIGGAIVAAAAVTVEHCAVGAFLGFLIYRGVM
jgi:hypothetical protein